MRSQEPRIDPEAARPYGWILALVLPFLFAAALPAASARTAEEWLDFVDRNLLLLHAEYSAMMTIHHPDGTERRFAFNAKVAGDKYALLEYTEPPRDKGIRYLKREDKLWIYFPRQDRTLMLQGHMLRQGVQGGDLSYEDMTESSSMREMYTAEVISENDSTVTLELTSNDPSVSYPHRTLVIEKSSGLPLKMVFAGLNGRPIKEMEVVEASTIFGRRFPVVSIYRSRLVENKWTRFELSGVRFGVEFPPDTFTQRALSR